MAKKLTDRNTLIKYIKAKQGGRKYLELMLVYSTRRNTTELIEELDAIDRLLAYIDKLMDKTPNFKLYMANLKRGDKMQDVIGKETGISLTALNEEAYYLCQHIITYEEKNEE